MALKQKYATQEEIPEEQRGFYVQREEGGPWFLDSEEASELVNAHERTKTANQELRDKIQELEQNLGKFEGVDPEEVTKLKTQLQKMEEEQEAKAAGATSEEVEQLLQERTERMREKHRKEIELRDQQNQEMKEQLKREKDLRRMDLVGEKAVAAFLATGGFDTPSVREDVRNRALQVYRFDDEGDIKPFDEHGAILRGEDGVKPLDFKEWALSLKDGCRHYWPAKAGIGADQDPGKSDGGANEEELMKLDPERRLEVIRAQQAS